MECTGRALSFWAYQTTQEVYYQQYLYKTLAEKYSNLNMRLDQIVSDANAEIERLQSRLNSQSFPIVSIRSPLANAHKMLRSTKKA